MVSRAHSCLLLIFAVNNEDEDNANKTTIRVNKQYNTMGVGER